MFGAFGNDKTETKTNPEFFVFYILVCDAVVSKAQFSP